MKKVLLSLLAVILIVGVLGAAGFAGYQYGFRQGALISSTANGKSPIAPFPKNIGPNGMPMMPNFGFDRGFGPRGFGMMRHGMGFGFFSPLIFLLRIAFWVFVIWLVYMLVSRSGWRLTRKTTETPPATPTEPNDNEPVGD